MSNEKLKEIRLTKQAKYGIASMCLAAILGVGVASFMGNGEEDIIVNNNAPENDQQVTVTPDDTVVEKEEINEEKLSKPFNVDAIVKTYYFDINDNSKDQENALIYYNGMYTPSLGVDYFYNNVSFDVLASFSGTVIDKKVDPLYGATVSIKAENSELIAVYASLTDIKVNKGDYVNQGQVIAKAGSNSLNSNMGNHLNFSLLKDDKRIDPLDYYFKELSKI